MAEITAAAVKSFRERTGLPLMDCKKALQEAGGDQEAAIEVLRKRGQQLADKRSDRETAFGRFGLYIGSEKSVGAMVELLCESAPVTTNEDFVQLADDLASVYATTPSVNTAEELLAQPSPSAEGKTLAEQKDDLFNRIREVFNVGRMARVEGATGGYMHHAGTTAGVMLAIEGGTDEAAKDVSMHVAAMKPAALDTDSLDPEIVNKEREILKQAALAEGKPDNIVEKMVEGRINKFFQESCLMEQVYIKDPDKKVSDLLTQTISTLGENISVNRFSRFSIGD
ncbi:MAG: translation elongation factor Ts [Rubripirellula sp.]